MSEAVRLRPAAPADADAIAALWHAGWHDAHAASVPPALLAERGPALFRERTPGILPVLVVAKAGGRVVGIVAWKNDELDQLFVAPEFRGRGVAAMLLERGEAELRACGTNEAFLLCFVGNERARRFYVRSGWRETAVVDYPARTSRGIIEVRSYRFVKDLDASHPAEHRRDART